MPQLLHPHGPLRALGPGLWALEGSWKRSPLKRRMTAMELPGAGLLLHSSMRLSEPERRRMLQLGTPRVLVVPNAFHGSEAGAWAEDFPDAALLVPEEAEAKLRRTLPRIDGTLESDWPAACAGVVERASLRGTRFAEVAFLHRPSRTLVLTDLCFHVRSRDLPPVARLLMRLNDVGDRFGPSRLARHVFVRDREALRRSLEPVLAWNFDRVIVSHGDVLEHGGREAMEAAMGFLRR